MHSRRSFLRFSLLAAPAVVAASSLMPIRGIILPEEIDTQEIIAILAGRLDEGALGFDEQRGVWVGGKYPGWPAYGRGTYTLEGSLRRAHEMVAEQTPKIIPPPDHIWAGWK